MYLALRDPELTGINNLGQISGYGGAGEIVKGFVLDSSGTVSTIYQPGSTETKTLGLNDAGQVVGGFRGMGGSHAYVGDTSVLMAISVPGATATPQASGINSSGNIVGNFMAGGVARGFLDTSGAGRQSTSGSSGTQALGVNDAGQIVGSFSDRSGEYHAFLDNGGLFTALNVPALSARSTQTE